MLHGRAHLTGHDPASGKQFWSYPAECNTTATVTTDGRNIYLPGNGIHALRFDDATRQAKPLWYELRLRGGKASPVAHDGKIYVVKSPAIFICADARDGKILWQVRLKGKVWATPVVADGHAYVVSHDGTVQVVQLGEEGTLVGTSQLDGGILASPAVAGGAIYFRSDSHLWKVALTR